MNALARQSSLEQAYERPRENFEHIVGYLSSKEASSMTHSELERELDKKGRELMRLLLQEHLNNRGPGESVQQVSGTDGIERGRERTHERNIESVFGRVSLQRIGYCQEGSDSLHPLDAELNLPKELYSLELRRRVAEQAAKSSFDDTIDSIDKTTGIRIGKRQVEQLAQRAAVDFEEFYQNRHRQVIQNPAVGTVLVVSVDGKGIVMRTEDLREKTRKAAQARAHKMGKRLSKGEKKNAKRMATVAAVYTVMPFVRTPEQVVAPIGGTLARAPRPLLENKRVWASIEKEPEQVIAQALAEARYRDPDYEKDWVALVDGNKPQILELRRMARKNNIKLTIIVDIIHVIEYLWAAGRVFHPESGPQLEDWVRHRLLAILQGKAGLMAGGMRRSATRQGLSAQQRKPVDKCARYLLNHSRYLHYDQYLGKGLPIATGVIEGACRHLVKDRMEVTGARWSLVGAEAVLRLRALRCSGDFDNYWSFHEACEYKRTHENRYFGGVVPPTNFSPLATKRSHLTAIK
jgi:hypothetical protein